MIPIRPEVGSIYVDSLGAIWRVVTPSNFNEGRVNLRLLYAGQGVATMVTDEAMNVGKAVRLFSLGGAKIPQFAPQIRFDYSKWYIEKEIVP